MVPTTACLSSSLPDTYAVICCSLCPLSCRHHHNFSLTISISTPPFFFFPLLHNRVALKGAFNLSIKNPKRACLCLAAEHLARFPVDASHRKQKGWEQRGAHTIPVHPVPGLIAVCHRSPPFTHGPAASNPECTRLGARLPQAPSWFPALLQGKIEPLSCSAS